MNGDSGDDAGSASDSAVDRGDDDAAELEEPAATEDSPDDQADGGTTSSREVYREGDRAYAVRSRQLSRDLALIQDRVLAVPTDASALDYDNALVYAPQAFPCELPPAGRGVLVAVRYDGGPAFVRFLEPIGESQVVEVLQCGTGDLLRSTTLPTQG